MYNSTSGVIQQAVNAIIQFVLRKVVLVYLGVEILGINSTFASVISAASLADSGITGVVIYRLYKAIQDEDEHEVNELVNIARFYMSCIGWFVIATSIILLPFIPSLLTEVEFTPVFYVYFELHALATAFSYFLSYKRVILSADRSGYLANIADTASNVLFTIARIVAIILWKNYTIYLSLSLIQVIFSNITIQIVSQYRYKFLRRQKVNKEKLKSMIPEIKNLFMGTVAAFIYKSSDNIIISKIISTIMVGYVGNYTTVTNCIKTVALSALSIMGPVMGNMAVNKNDWKKLNLIFNAYDYILYVVCLMLIVPESILIQTFVSNIWGAEYVLSYVIVALLVMDQYLTLVQDSNGVLLSVTGKFKELKVADGSAAITNIVLSILFAYKWGVEGILAATVISRIIQWLLKSYYAQLNYLEKSKEEYFRYWFDNLGKALLFIICMLVCGLVSGYVDTKYFWCNFVIKGASIVFIATSVAAVYGILTGKLKLIIDKEG
jgi:O-antigen/teichoic acid export membrane protein